MHRSIIVLVALTVLCCAGTEEIQQTYYRLDNGLTVMLRPADGARHTVLMVLYGVGGRHDPEGMSGLAHLTEQIYVTAPAGESPVRTAEQFMQQYPEGWNAQTGELYTLVATIFEREHLAREIEDAAARMGDLRISEPDIERERDRVLQEIANMYERVPMLVAFNQAREQVVPSPEGTRRGGLAEDVLAITLNDVRSHWERFYKPANAVVILAGDFDLDDAMTLVKKHFDPLPSGEEAPPPRPRPEPVTGLVTRVPAEAVTPEATSVACLAYAAPPPESGIYVPFLALVARMWSRAIELGVTPEHFPVRYAPLDDPWVVAVTDLVRDEKDTDRVVATLKRFISETIEQELSADEIARTRNTFGFALGLTDYTQEMLRENPYAVALGLGRRWQLGIDTQTISQRLETLTTDDIRRAGKAVFAPERCATVIATLP